jgi:hypothetical protein
MGSTRCTGTDLEKDDGSIQLDLHLAVTGGIVMVQETAPQDVPPQRQIQAVFPRALGEGKPQEVDALPGAIMVMVRRIREDFSRVSTPLSAMPRCSRHFRRVFQAARTAATNAAPIAMPQRNDQCRHFTTLMTAAIVNAASFGHLLFSSQ